MERMETVHRIDMEPIGRRSEVEPGQTLLDAARQGGIDLTALCGGEGWCHGCKVRVIEGKLSPATVSKALSGASDVSVATREKVREAAGKTGYIPDGRARALSQNRSWTISVLCQDGSEMGLRHYLFAEIIESFKSVVERHGYDILFISNQVGKMGLSYYGHCRYRKADGVFIVNTNHSSGEARELMDSDLT